VLLLDTFEGLFLCCEDVGEPAEHAEILFSDGKLVVAEVEVLVWRLLEVEVAEEALPGLVLTLLVSLVVVTPLLIAVSKL
jgi:hypothetical protein